MKARRPQPPSCAPEGTVWFGGPIDGCSVSLRVYGDDLAPEEVSRLLQIEPTDAERKGARTRIINGKVRKFSRRGRWILELSDKDCGEWDLEEVIKCLLTKLPSKTTVWRELHRRYHVDLFCCLHMEALNRGFGLSPEVSSMLAERRLEIGFDIYGPEEEMEKSPS
jgi:hypothetical protein